MAQMADLGRFAQDVGEGWRRGHDLAQPANLLPKLAGLARPLGRDHELLDLERLGDEIVGAGADGGDGGLQAAEGGDDDDGQVRPLIQEATAQLQSVHLRHVDVDQRRIEIAIRHGGERRLG